MYTLFGNCTISIFFITICCRTVTLFIHNKIMQKKRRKLVHYCWLFTYSKLLDNSQNLVENVRYLTILSYKKPIDFIIFSNKIDSTVTFCSKIFCLIKSLSMHSSNSLWNCVKSASYENIIGAPIKWQTWQIWILRFTFLYHISF